MSMPYIRGDFFFFFEPLGERRSASQWLWRKSRSPGLLLPCSGFGSLRSGGYRAGASEGEDAVVPRSGNVVT